ncbi:MAG TPA: DUF397 domain-containing protein [Pseudonocardiaceae bacterium]|nr:DUF397 domain-containing protein [Pseudonocardiaceae bacterium]
MSTVDLSGVAWRKSSRSGNGDNGNCVEVGFTETAVAVRDSKSPATGALVLPAAGWAGFLSGLTTR